MMNFENQQNANGLEVESTSPAMIDEAVAGCMISTDDIDDRALEFVIPDEVDVLRNWCRAKLATHELRKKKAA